MDKSRKPKSLTELAIDKKRMAAHKRAIAALGYGHGFEGREAEIMEKEANELLELDHPPVTNLGEVVGPQTAGLPSHRRWLQDTLKNGNRVAEDASIRRTDLLLQESFDLVALAVDAADSIKAENSLEKMLAHQMALAHEASFKIMAKAMNYANSHELRQGDCVELARLTNAAARLMGVYQEGLLTLDRLRTGRNQTVTVQHVHVNPGAQALIGNVQTGGLAGGEKQKDG